VGQKHSPPDGAFCQAVDEVLHYVWGPIGVSMFPEARDEYHSYLPQVFAHVREGRSPQDIAALLALFTTEPMGLTARPDVDLSVAYLLVYWKRVIGARYA
jgi:hypothetical protein